MTSRSLPLWAPLLASCGASAPMSSLGPAEEGDAVAQAPMGALDGAEAEALAKLGYLDEANFGVGGGAKDKRTRGAELAKAEGRLAARDEPNDDAKPSPTGSDPGKDEAPETRRWFPEAFLWRPLVQTGTEGQAVVDVDVPHQLTTWRILALAHDRQGQQAGSVHTFDTRLPIYVDPVVPGFLYSGDRLMLPVQAVNGTPDPVVADLRVEASGSMSGLGRATVALGSGGSDVRTIPLEVTGAGTATILGRLSADGVTDSAERRIPVSPAGRPVEQRRGSTVSGNTRLHLPPPTATDPQTETLQIVVFPGPLAVLQSEVERIAAGARPADGAYGFAVASHLRTLAEVAGVEVEDRVLRKLEIVSWQRIVPYTHAPTAGQAADLLTALARVADHDLVDGLRPRLAATVIADQRADGTWSRQPTSTLQRVLVDTGIAARSLPADATGPRLRARGAIERLADQVDDGYTASILLAAGLVQGAQADAMMELVESMITVSATGQRSLDLPPGVTDPWGLRPTRAQALAYAALALPDDHEARGDLVGQLMGGWSARHGFGAGLADAVALDAIAQALPTTPQQIDVALTLDGVQAATARLDPTQPRVPAILDAAPGGLDVEIGLTATPEVPGLSFVATRRSWVPWSAGDASALAGGRRGGRRPGHGPRQPGHPGADDGRPVRIRPGDRAGPARRSRPRRGSSGPGPRHRRHPRGVPRSDPADDPRVRGGGDPGAGPAGQHRLRRSVPDDPADRGRRRPSAGGVGAGSVDRGGGGVVISGKGARAPSQTAPAIPLMAPSTQAPHRRGFDNATSGRGGSPSPTRPATSAPHPPTRTPSGRALAPLPRPTPPRGQPHPPSRTPPGRALTPSSPPQPRPPNSPQGSQADGRMQRQRG